MAFQISPGINITEIDRTGVVNQIVSNTSAAYVGNYKWGPVEQITTISTENELASKFGQPDDTNFGDFFSAANFIGYGARLQVIRASNVAVTVAGRGNGYTAPATNSGISGSIIWNDSLYSKLTNDGISAGAQNSNGTSPLKGVVCAKYPGVLGNSLLVSYSDNVARGIAFGTTLVSDDVQSTGRTVSIDASGLSAMATADWEALAVGDYLKFTSSTNAKQYEILGLSGGTDSTQRNITMAVPGSTSEAVNLLVGRSGATAVWKYTTYLNYTPSTSVTTTQKGYKNDEVAFAIVDEDGFISGTRGTVLETFIGSKALNGTNLDGTNSFYGRKIGLESQYVRWISHPEGNGSSAGTAEFTAQTTAAGLSWGASLGVVGATTGFRLLKANVYCALNGGTDPNPTITDMFKGYDIFEDTENTESNLLLQGSHGTAVANYVVELASKRKDAIAFVSPPLETVKDLPGQLATDSIIAWRSGELIADTSYAVVDSGWKYIYDKYNDTYRWVPLNPDIAGLCARTDSTANPWFSPAGYNRGIIRNVVKLAFNPAKQFRDALYTYGINPVVTQAGSGTVLLGDKTALLKPSAFGRISFRRLFVALEKAVATAAKFQLFEFNDEFARANFIGLIEPFLREVQASKGISEFKIICDETNNTQEVIDKNQFNADIYVKPNATVNYVQLNFVASNSQANFAEIGAVTTI